MGVAVLLFGLVVGIFHFQDGLPGSEAASRDYALSSTTEEPANYADGTRVTPPAHGAVGGMTSVDAPVAISNPYPRIADARTPQELAQVVADLTAAQPADASAILAEALRLDLDDRTLGDVATLAAAATRAAPGEARSIAAVLARSLGDSGDSALAASIATVVSLVPEQSRDIGLVVGAILGEDLDALAMIGQTVAIATGEETFSSLAEASGVSQSAIMSRSSRLGVNVPFDVPAYAAQHAPSASMVADGAPEPAQDDDT